jgi:hypothetical protein
MGVSVAFDYDTWTARFPEFSTVPEAYVAQLWDEAGVVYLRNDGTGSVYSEAMQTVLMNLLTAHLCKLYAMIGGQASPDTVGRINNASEGSVSVSLAWEGASPGQAWFLQTKYGAAYWQAIASKRTMHYRVPRPRNFNPFYSGR